MVERRNTTFRKRPARPSLPPTARHVEEPDEEKVGYGELLFDLVFVFSIIQLSHTMARDFSVKGCFEIITLILAVWWVWIYTTWVFNFLSPESPPGRLLLVLLMFLGLVVSISIPTAYAGPRARQFAVAYVTMQVGRSLYMVVLFWSHDDEHPKRATNFVRITGWKIISGIFWILGGWAALESTRLVLWPFALTLEYLAPAHGFWLPGLGSSRSAEWDVLGAHMAERCALFILICLGESVLNIGTVISEKMPPPMSARQIAAALACFWNLILLWWTYFRFTHAQAAQFIDKHPTPGRVAREAFTYAHIPIVVGIVLTAVSMHFVLELDDVVDYNLETKAFAVVGGPFIHLFGTLWFRTVVSNRLMAPHVVGLCLLGGLYGLTWSHCISGVLLLATLTALIMFHVAAWEFHYEHHHVEVDKAKAHLRELSARVLPGLISSSQLSSDEGSALVVVDG